MSIIFILQAMEWERVKGGINAILAAYEEEYGDLFDTVAPIAKKFIEEFGEKSGID